ncbi:MAG: hypothetical protein PCFJNLEI_03752 [Verrucomicrobiae bacterium]|nr:hypothetical protein [Verrucomicrobiae bacterium]
MGERMQISIRLKLTALVAGAVMLTVLGLSVGSYYFVRQMLQHQIHDRLQVVTADRQKLVLMFVQLQLERVSLVASRITLPRLLENLTDEQAQAQARRSTQDALQSTVGVLAIWVVDRQGQVVLTTDATVAGRNYAGTVEFTEGLAQPYMEMVSVQGAHRRAVLAAPIRGTTGVVGVVMMLAEADKLEHLLTDRTGLGATGAVILGTREGAGIRYLFWPETANQPVAGPTQPSPALVAAVAGQMGFKETTDEHGHKVLAAYRPVGHRQWGILTKMDLAEAYGPINSLRTLFVTIESIVFVVALLVSYWLATRFTEPILRLAGMAESIAGGGLRAQVVVESNDEVGRLGQSFNKMSEELAHSYGILEDRVAQRTAELKAERDLLQGLLDNTPDRIYFKDLQSRFIRMNNGLAKFFGLASPAEAVGKTDFDFFSQEHAQQAYDDEQLIIRTGQAMMGLEEKETWPDGHLTWASTTKVPLRDASGQIVGTFGISRDITDRKRAEEELNRYFELSPDLFCIADRNGFFKRLSPAWSSVLGYTQQELLEQPFLNFVHEDDRAATVVQYDRIREGGRAIQFENRYRCKDGSYRWLQWNAVPVPEQQVVHAVARDVSEHKRAQELLSRFADALNKKNLEMQEDLKMAREVHQVFVPKTYPVFPVGSPAERSRLRFAHRYLPTSALGGDFFDIFPVSKTEAGIVICDVMGHGMRAALVTSIIRGLLDKFRNDAGDPSKYLEDINRALLANLQTCSATIFATACYLVVDVHTGRVRVANAGHPGPFIIRTTGQTVEQVNGTTIGRAPALGLTGDATFPTTTVALGVQDRLVLYTDGLYEVETKDGQEYGIERFAAALRRRINVSDMQLLDEVLAEARLFAATGEFTDDVCLLSVELTGWAN